MIPNFQKLSNEILGSSLALPANGLGGSRATSSLVAHFALQNTASNSAEKSVRRKVLGAKPKQAGKKEGGFGGNSAFPLRNQIEASPATCPNTWRAEHRQFVLSEKS